MLRPVALGSVNGTTDPPSSGSVKGHSHESNVPTMTVVPVGFMRQMGPEMGSSAAPPAATRHSMQRHQSAKVVNTVACYSVSSSSSSSRPLAPPGGVGVAQCSTSAPTPSAPSAALHQPKEEELLRASQGFLNPQDTLMPLSSSASGRDLLVAEFRRHCSGQRDASEAPPPLTPRGSGRQHPPSTGSIQFKEEWEQERAKSRRKHRKSVARIVVDHWKWFARDRLKVWGGRV